MTVRHSKAGKYSLPWRPCLASLATPGEHPVQGGSLLQHAAAHALDSATECHCPWTAASCTATSSPWRQQARRLQGCPAHARSVLIPTVPHCHYQMFWSAGAVYWDQHCAKEKPCDLGFQGGHGTLAAVCIDLCIQINVFCASYSTQIITIRQLWLRLSSWRGHDEAHEPRRLQTTCCLQQS